MSPQLQGGGLSVTVPPGWEGRFTRPAPQPRRNGAPGGEQPALRQPEQPMPYLHLATFPLPQRRGTFGGGAVETMGAEDAFVALVEYPRECVHRPLFPQAPFPRHLRPSLFHHHSLQHIVPGQAGYQRFFTHAGRALCLYVVLGGERRARTLVPEVNGVLRSVNVSAP
jgi:hypothetical protein